MIYSELEDDIVARLAPIVTAGHEVEYMPSKPSDNKGMQHNGRITVFAGKSKGNIDDIHSLTNDSIQDEFISVQVIIRAKRLRTDGGRIGCYELADLAKKLLIGYKPDNCVLPLKMVGFEPIDPDGMNDNVFSFVLDMITKTVAIGDPDQDVSTLIEQITVTGSAQVGPIIPTVQLYSSGYSVLNSGDQVVLAWFSENADTVTIDNGIGEVSANGSTTVTITGDVTYTVTAVNGDETATASVSITLGLNCDDATVQLNGSTIGTIPSGDTDSFTVNLDGVPSGSWDGDSWEVTSNPCADATVQLNGVDMADIASGDTENILVLQSNDITQVGSKQGTHWSIDDSEISINGSPVADVKSEDSLDIPVTQDGSPVGSWNGSAFIIPSCPAGGGSISVAVSDTSPSIGDMVTITATPSSFTPDSYLYFAYDGTGEIIFIAEQASNTFNWTIPSIEVGTYEIYVLGVENGTLDVTAFGTQEVTISSAFLLDTPEGAGANFAFQFSRLRGGYSDVIALVRRSNDQQQKSFYLDTNNSFSLLSEDGSGTTFGDWLGNADAYLVTGYSQDLSGVTFTAANAANQAKIATAGVLEDLNGVVAMVGNSNNYTISAPLTVNSAFIVAQNDAYSTINYVLGGNNQGFSWGGSFSGITGIGMKDAGNTLFTSVEDFNPHLASFLADTGVYVDGGLSASGTIDDPVVTRIGTRSDSPTSSYMRGKIACIVTYATDKTADRAAIEANIDNNFTPSLLP